MKVQLKSLEVTIAAAATAQPLSEESLIVSSLIVKCLSGNTTVIKIGASGAENYTIEKGESLPIIAASKSAGNDEMDLREIYVKAGTNGDKVQVLYTVRPK